LQANPKCAGTETLRFVLNTTIGVAGLFDPAKKRFNLEKQDKDFGQTLGIWGMGPVFYIDLPILGPSSLRDGLGYAVDTALNPQTYLTIYSVTAGFISTGGWVLDKVNEASLTLGEYEDLKKAALDPYIALREAYHQYRENKIRGR
jgi:phospholipid-binding lipoprotein MlaA